MSTSTPESPEQSQIDPASILYRIAEREMREKRNQENDGSNRFFVQWIKDLLGQARKSVQLDAPKVRIYLQVYTPQQTRAVRILKLPKTLFM